MRHLILAVSIAICFATVMSAQAVRTRPAPTDFALEVAYFEGRAPAYEPVQRLKLPKGEGSYFGMFGHVHGWQLPAGALPVGAVRVVPYLDGEAVSVSFSVLRGKYLDVEEMVGTVSLRENEVMSVDSLRDFGVEPFRIKLVRVAPQASEVPSVVNKSRLLEVVGIEPLVATFPRYKLTLHNLSDKNIVALSLLVMRDGKLAGSGMPHGERGEALVKANSFGEWNQRLATRAETTAAGFTPATSGSQQIVIASVMFEDGTYEGDAAAAARYQGFMIGHRTELSRILPVLENALATSAAKETVRQQLSQLSYDYDNGALASLGTKFPAVDRSTLKTSIEVSMHSIRKEALDEIDRSTAAGADFSACLQRLREGYANWLARLNQVATAR